MNVGNADDRPVQGGVDLLQAFSFGEAIEDAQKGLGVALLAENYLIQPIHYAADRLGLAVNQIERCSQHKLADRDIWTAITIQAGTVGLVSMPGPAMSTKALLHHRSVLLGER